MKPSRKVWVLSTEYNEYDQHGAYFVAVFAEKPSVKQLAEVLQGQIYLGDVLEALALIEHIREGGGRRDSEDQWFNLDEEELK